MSGFNNLEELNLSDDVRALNPELVSQKTSKPSKYKNARTTSFGMTFQSGHEAAGVAELMILDEHQQIFGLRLQVRFPLPGKNTYIADAVYLQWDEHIGQLISHIVDFKAWDKKTGKFLLTQEFKIKAKLFEERYGQPVELI